MRALGGATVGLHWAIEVPAGKLIAQTFANRPRGQRLTRLQHSKRISVIGDDVGNGIAGNVEYDAISTNASAPQLRRSCETRMRGYGLSRLSWRRHHQSHRLAMMLGMKRQIVVRRCRNGSQG